MVRAVDFVAAKGIKIDVPGAHVDQPVRGVGDAVDAQLGADGVNPAGDLGDRRNRA